jgi:hypothetical protein
MDSYTEIPFLLYFVGLFLWMMYLFYWMTYPIHNNHSNCGEVLAEQVVEDGCHDTMMILPDIIHDHHSENQNNDSVFYYRQHLRDDEILYRDENNGDEMIVAVPNRPITPTDDTTMDGIATTPSNIDNSSVQSYYHYYCCPWRIIREADEDDNKHQHDDDDSTTTKRTRQKKKLLLLCRFCWGMAGGSMTGMLNFVKDTLTVLDAMNDVMIENSSSNTASSSVQQTTIPRDCYLFLFFLIFMGVFAAYSGLVLLSLCMKRYDVTFSAAMFIGSYVLSASIMSWIHYDTFEHLQQRHVICYILYPMGLFILLCGVYILVMESTILTTTTLTSSSQHDPTNPKQQRRHPHQQEQRQSLSSIITSNPNPPSIS